MTKYVKPEMEIEWFNEYVVTDDLFTSSTTGNGSGDFTGDGSTEWPYQ